MDGSRTRLINFTIIFLINLRNKIEASGIIILSLVLNINQVRMKLILAILFLIVVSTLAFSPLIRNTKTTGTLNGTTGDFCQWEGVQLWPLESLNQPGKCRVLTCSSDFDINVESCLFDITGRYTFHNMDGKKLYPECCGEQRDSYMESEFSG